MKKLIQYIIGIVFVLFIAQPAICADIIVAKSGGDYRTIQAGLDAASPGDTVRVKAGVYAERVTWRTSGTAGRYITLTNYGDGEVIIDGKGLGSIYTSGVLRASGKDYIKIIGLTVRNGMCQISIHNGDYVEIRDNTTIGEATGKVWGDSATKTERRGPGILIATYGTRGRSTNVIVDNNDISQAAEMHYESLRIMGHVSNFEVTNNHVHDCDYIGIDIVGRSTDSHGMPSDGLIDGNVVHNNKNRNGRGFASGIYVDCATDLTISNNISYDHGYGGGFQIACEQNGNSTERIMLKNNLSYNNTHNYIIGHYDNYSAANNITMYNNTAYEAHSYYALKVRSGNNHVFKNNIFYQSNGKVFQKDSFSGSDLSFSRNLWYGKKGPGTDSLTADPRFVDPQKRNFNLSPDSPAIDKGKDVGLPFYGSAPDMGAYEYTEAEEQKTILAPSNLRIVN
jgi:hypothetical protein